MPPTTEKLAALKKKRDQLAAQISDMEAREKKKEKAIEDKKKILLGAWILHRVENGDMELFERLRRELPEFLTRQRDREFMAGFLNQAD